MSPELTKPELVILRKTCRAFGLTNCLCSLYGQPSHLDYIASALREKHGDQFLILAVERNTGNLTYDGIELGGERVALEIEESIEKFSSQGYNIKKLSIVGYSLGGLISRYAIGLLYSRGYFDKITPVNFTTFATPHVGVRSPARRNHFWNVLGARTISKSGRQLFMIDDFRGTGKPLLSILAAKESIFMLGLARFKRRCVYANVVNDRAAVFYTTGISKTDPFAQLNKVAVNYVPGYAPVVIDPDHPVRPRENSPDGVMMVLGRSIASCVSRLPFLLFLYIFVPVATVVYLINAAIQTAKSRRRIRLHEEGKLGVPLSFYKVPFIVEEMRNVVEEMYETVNSTREPEYLSDNGDHDEVDDTGDLNHVPQSPQDGAADAPAESSAQQAAESEAVQTLGIPSNSPCKNAERLEFPTLALTPAQFTIIDNLNSVGFRKYPVYIHMARHSHAAIIVRMPRKSFDEGKIVIRHWLEEEFHV